MLVVKAVLEGGGGLQRRRRKETRDSLFKRGSMKKEVTWSESPRATAMRRRRTNASILEEYKKLDVGNLRFGSSIVCISTG